jgi:spore maturation protein CgeB
MSPLLQSLKKIHLAVRFNAAVKARQQERRAARNLQICRDEAARQGIIEPTETELIDTLRRRLSDRPHPAWPKPKGSLHVFMAYYRENWEFVFPLSMVPFGKVTVFDWRERGYDSLQSNWLEKRDAMNAEMLDAFKAAHAQQPIDAVVGYLSGHNTSPETLQAMTRMGAAIFNCNYDDKLHMPGRNVGGRDTSPAGIAHAVDLNLTNAPESVLKYFVYGGLAVFCPQGAQPDIHKPQAGGFEYDVSFIGAKYGWRPRFISALEARGIHVDCFGKGWPSGPISDADVIRIFSHSRINLGMAGVAHSRKLCCLKGRDYEIPMSGGLYLTQYHSDLPYLYDVGIEIEAYRDADDCAQKIRALLADPQRADVIRQAGYRRAVNTHSWEARWDRAFKLAGIIE